MVFSVKKISDPNFPFLTARHVFLSKHSNESPSLLLNVFSFIGDTVKQVLEPSYLPD